MRLRHRNPQAARPYVRSDKYLRMSRAILELLPERGVGHTTEELVERLLLILPVELFPTTASIRWCMMAVRSDLEARGSIQRVGPRKPVRYLSRPGEAPGTERRKATILIPDWSAPDRPDFPRRRAG